MAINQEIPKLSLFPLTAEVNECGNLVIGGCDCIELAEEFGTPLYVFDEFSLRSRCAEFKSEFGQRYPGTVVAYAGKAFTNKAVVRLVQEEGLALDVVSEGEMGIARSVGFPMDKVYFHGNNKSAGELSLALQWQVGRIVVDNFDELARLSKIAQEQNSVADIMLRLSPGIDPHTHEYNTTGIVDSKFGFPWVAVEEAIAAAMAAPNLNLVGLHFHLGSLIFEIEPYKQAIGRVLDFASVMR